MTRHGYAWEGPQTVSLSTGNWIAIAGLFLSTIVAAGGVLYKVHTLAMEGAVKVATIEERQRVQGEDIKEIKSIVLGKDNRE